jgi:hypothetical protein
LAIDGGSSVDRAQIEGRRNKAEIFGMAHGMAADRNRRLNRFISLPIIVLSTIVGATSLSAFVDFGPNHTAKFLLDLVFCLFAIAVAVLTALQTFCGYAARAQGHTDTAASLAALGRRWDALVFESPSSNKVEALDNEFDEIIKRAPRISVAEQEFAAGIQAKARPHSSLSGGAGSALE